MVAGRGVASGVVAKTRAIAACGLLSFTALSLIMVRRAFEARVNLNSWFGVKLVVHKAV